MAGIEAINNAISNEPKAKKSSGRTKNQDRWLLKSIDNGGTHSVITSNLRKISNDLNVKISKSD